MRFRVTFHDPDAANDAIRDAAAVDAGRILGLTEGERAAITEIRRGAAEKVASIWLRYGEYLEIEIDTDERTARVVPVAEQTP